MTEALNVLMKYNAFAPIYSHYPIHMCVNHSMIYCYSFYIMYMFTSIWVYVFKRGQMCMCMCCVYVCEWIYVCVCIYCWYTTVVRIYEHVHACFCKHVQYTLYTCICMYVTCYQNREFLNDASQNLKRS